jgi:non-homologous end joining protein Ku
MIQQIISDIEAKIRAEQMSDARKSELLKLIATLKREVTTLEMASSTTQEKQKVLKSSVDELRSSVEGFEQSHPKLVQAINSISNTLSNWGI